MKFDTIIAGGGLSGLVAGIRLARLHRKVAVISNGQSALHFCSGSFGLLGSVGGKAVKSPVEAMSELEASHPYRRIGLDRVKVLADAVPSFFSEAGISLKGSSRENHYQLTPLGIFKPAWLTMSDFMSCGASGPSFERCVIVNFKAYPDFYPHYLADGLRRCGVESTVAEVEVEAVERLRRSSGDMRAASIARQLRGDALEQFAMQINRVSGGADAVLIPAVVGFDSEEQLAALRRMVAVPLYCVPVTPMSVSGFRAQMLLRRHFERLGGTYLLGDNAVAAHFGADGSLSSIETAGLGSDALSADNFILATGGIFSRGIVAEPHRVYEPLLGVDVDAPADRDQWYRAGFFSQQPYMGFGASVDEAFHPFRSGKPLPNVYAAGAVLGSYDGLAEGSGSGVAILTALHVADLILNS
ncbi:MAG: anaerobic glycerol-3-phosphate dehydrogenase subunit B [Muribaculaceae bacterium]|nr:anaerobic glycerol-3-phosphate dehydrogenase subunit B [Muribaculaceae bacterium]